MKKIILIMIFFLLFTSCSSNDHYESNSNLAIENESVILEESVIIPDEKALETFNVLSQKFVDFNSFLMNMAEYGPYNIDYSKTFMKDNCMYAEYNFDNFYCFQNENYGTSWEKEIYSFSSINEIEKYILSFFVSLDDSNYSQIISHLFVEENGKLFYNTNEESAMLSFSIDLETVSIIDKTETKIILHGNRKLTGEIVTFTMVKNENGEWRLTKDIYE